MQQGHLIEEAIAIIGGRRLAAEKLGCSRVLVGLMANNKTRVTAETAMNIQIATKHKVTAEELRPDLPWKEIRKSKRK
jgi:DNA-binding transcriptional regulator YdaS (Cro superfamily)